ncbi:MAG: DUF4868 domain-containing protein [Mediterranea sp.]|jgi:hypothetical protein|nr:DUF4868 domain-containing protein [Mediterranea sp.]
MNREEFIGRLIFLEFDEIPTVEIFVLAQPSINDSEISCDIYKTHLHERIPESIKEAYYPKIKKSLITSDYDLTEYNPALMPDRDVIWNYNSSIVPFYNIIVERLVHVDNFYNNEILPYDEIWAIWIKFQVQNNTFYLLKKITPSKVFTVGGSLSVIFKDDVFSKLESDVLTIDGTFDVLAFENMLYFENKQNFERALLYQTVKREVAIATLDEINEIGILENFDAVKNYLKDDQHSINKLNRIKSKPYFRTLTFNHCKQIIDDYGLNLSYDETTGKFNIQNKKEAKMFVKVLNDDFLKSEMTNIKYAANSKEDLL